MRALAKTSFAVGGKVYAVGRVYPLEGLLLDDVAELERIGWIAVLLEDVDDPIRLANPETTLRLTRRNPNNSPGLCLSSPGGAPT